MDKALAEDKPARLLDAGGLSFPAQHVVLSIRPSSKPHLRYQDARRRKRLSENSKRSQKGSSKVGMKRWKGWKSKRCERGHVHFRGIFL